MVSTDAISPTASPQRRVPKTLELFCFAFCVVNAVWLVTAAVTGSWLWDESGRLISTDFVNVWAAGKLALAGAPASAYDWTIHKQAEIAALGYDFKGYYGWHYPPHYLFVAALLAMLPYVPALVSWVAVSFILYVAAVRASTAHPAGFWLACAMPSLLSNVLVGQNGFLTAALIGGTLVFMERRPVLAGICLGLLTYKPQFGILFPLVLAAAGYWRVFWTAAMVAAVVSLAALAVFGAETWFAFARWLPVTSQTFLSEGQAQIQKMQSLFGVVRTLGGAEWLAWAAQILLAAAIAAVLCLMWRSKKYPYALKAAALGAGVLLATPYVYLYDLVALAIPVAFLVGLGLSQGFLRYELAALGAAALLIASFPFVKMPVGFAAAVVVALVIARRALSEPSRAAT